MNRICLLIFPLSCFAAVISRIQVNLSPPVAAPEDQKPDNGSQDQEEGALPMVIVGYATYWDSVMPDPTLPTT